MIDDFAGVVRCQILIFLYITMLRYVNLTSGLTLPNHGTILRSSISKWSAILNWLLTLPSHASLSYPTIFSRIFTLTIYFILLDIFIDTWYVILAWVIIMTRYVILTGLLIMKRTFVKSGSLVLARNLILVRSLVKILCFINSLDIILVNWIISVRNITMTALLCCLTMFLKIFFYFQILNPSLKVKLLHFRTIWRNLIDIFTTILPKRHLWWFNHPQWIKFITFLNCFRLMHRFFNFFLSFRRWFRIVSWGVLMIRIIIVTVQLACYHI